jgi:hydroxymethylbilane synthase
MRIRVGTRRSALARTQADYVIEHLKALDPTATFEIKLIQSGGDKDRVSEFQAFATIGVFTQTVEAALVNDEADIVVHSLKDLPTTLCEGLVLAAVPDRESPNDVLCGATLDGLRAGARVGTGSLRRRSQLLALRPDVEVVPIRGNLPPRLKRIQGSDALDAVILARAGLHRLDLGVDVSEELDPVRFPYAVGQGALGIECRAGDDAIIALLRRFENPVARAEVDAERAMLHALGAGCSLPVGVRTWWPEPGVIALAGQVTSLDGSERITASASGPSADATEVGIACATDLRRQGGVALIESSYRQLSAHHLLKHLQSAPASS